MADARTRVGKGSGAASTSAPRSLIIQCPDLSIRYTERLAETGITASVGSTRDRYDHALAETVNGLYKAEVIHHLGPRKNRAAVEMATTPSRSTGIYSSRRSGGKLSQAVVGTGQQGRLKYTNYPPQNPGRFTRGLCTASIPPDTPIHFRFDDSRPGFGIAFRPEGLCLAGIPFFRTMACQPIVMPSWSSREFMVAMLHSRCNESEASVQHICSVNSVDQKNLL